MAHAPTPLPPLKLVERRIDELRPNPRNARTHTSGQIAKIAASLQTFGFTSPVLLGRGDMILCGHGRVEAARRLGLTAVPTISLAHLTPEQQRAYALTDNRLAELAGWDHDLLALELQELSGLELDFELEITGFDGAELDQLLDPHPPAADPKADKLPEHGGPQVTRQGDIWILGPHRLVCGDARDSASYAALMQGERVRMAFADPPYNVPIAGHAGGKGKVARRNFVMAAGEMSPAEYTGFLTEAMQRMAEASCDGAIHFICIDWRHLGELLAAGHAVYAEQKNLIAWVKENAGLGSFYRSQHELIGVFKHGQGPHLNTFGLGGKGRFRTNVWSYPGASGFQAGRDEALAMHPTVKPVAMVVDAIKDVSRRGDLVLDPFGGSGTTLIAAQKTGRRARLIELDPAYCDTICRRFADYAGAPAILEATGQTFDELALGRTVRLLGHGHG